MVNEHQKKKDVTKQKIDNIKRFGWLLKDADAKKLDEIAATLDKGRKGKASASASSSSSSGAKLKEAHDDAKRAYQSAYAAFE